MSDDAWFFLLTLATLFIFIFLFFMMWLTAKNASKTKILSPYSGFPMRRAQDISNDTKALVYRYLESYHEFDNQPINYQNALFCRETGRIFPECRSWFGWDKVDWTFLQKRYPGNYLSWGSLPPDHQRELREAHGSISGYQTEKSSTQPSPRAVEPAYAFLKPGPLYVDVQTKILLGWKEVPGTDLEVLIVQKPIK